MKAVLNLQRDVDMRMRKLDWNDIKGYYEENHIDVINYQINDSDQEELTEKIIVAADILNKLIKTYKVFLFPSVLQIIYSNSRGFMFIALQE